MNRKPPGNYLYGGLLLLTVLFVDLLFLPRQIWPSDALAWRQETLSVLHGRLWIDPSVAAAKGEPGQYFDFNSKDGHWYSKYGVANTLMSLPPMEAIALLGGDQPGTAELSITILNLWNLLLSLLLAAVLYIITARYSDRPRRRAVFVLAAMFTTFLWYYQRAQGSEIDQVLLFALMYECLLRAVERAGSRWLTAAWVFVGLLVLMRVFFGLLIPLVFALVCVGLWKRKQKSWRMAGVLIAGPIVILSLLGWINQIKFGSPWLSGYHQWRPADHLLTGSWLDGVWGLLLSCHWSIFIYFPLLIAALCGARRFCAEHRFDAVAMISIFVTSLLALGKIPTWRGEWSYGPRYLVFVLPILSLPALGALDAWISQRRRLLLVLIVAMLGFSCWLQFEVNCADFWFFYRVQQPLDGVMDKETAQYFYDHPEGIIVHDLWVHRDDLDDSLLFSHLRQKLDPVRMDQYRQTVQQVLANGNLFWWPPSVMITDGSP